MNIIRLWAREIPSIERVWLFGSRARGSHKCDSDLDLAFELTDGELDWYDRRDWPALNLPIVVDMQFYNPTDLSSKKVGPGVRKDGIVIYDKMNV